MAKRAAVRSKAKDPPTSRARQGQGDPPTEDRIQTIVDMMAGLTWHPREHKRLAEEWGVTKSRVRQLASEASRVVKGSIGDTEQIRAEFVAALQGIAAEARYANPKPDYSSSIRALAEAADLMGMKKTRIEFELESDIDKGLTELAGLLSPETYHVVAQVLAGKGGHSAPRDGDGDAGESDATD